MAGGSAGNRIDIDGQTSTRLPFAHSLVTAWFFMCDFSTPSSGISPVASQMRSAVHRATFQILEAESPSESRPSQTCRWFWMEPT